jgi:DNA-binding PadR family transcriptional regulator
VYIDLLVLAHLLRQPAHGYEIKKNVARILGESITINNNLLYPTLRKLEQLGAVEKEITHQPGKPNRHIYHATPLGRDVFGTMLHAFPPEQAHSDAEFLVRVAFFHLLPPDHQYRIVRTRQHVLEERLRHLAARKPDADAHAYPYAGQVVDFRRRQVEHELAWIATLATTTLPATQHEEHA